MGRTLSKEAAPVIDRACTIPTAADARFLAALFIFPAPVAMSLL